MSALRSLVGVFLVALLTSPSALAQVSAMGSSFFKNPASCNSTTISNCSLSQSRSGATSGTCVSGYTGACSYSCFRKTWMASDNSCSPASCNLPWGGTLAHGGSVTAYSSTAPVGAACSTVSQTRTCNTGTLSGTYANGSCSSGCAAGATSNCNYSASAHNGASGTCASGYSGSCSYRCNNGTRSVVSNSCARQLRWTQISGRPSSAPGCPSAAPSGGTCYPEGAICVYFSNFYYRCQ
ncbi:hypothetical protein [Bdellovibrio bacteriovorus]|uniref:hypothetical protein n=1 Tax=Bdellovibrio bacteriovorus TaxID=959 RepID=UPI000B007B56|nr:hypothetical protein [Bdellovibrio bacteriovorus]